MMIPMIRSETKRICRQKCLGCVFKQKTNFASKENVHFCYEIISTAKDQSSLSPQKKTGISQISCGLILMKFSELKAQQEMKISFWE